MVQLEQEIDRGDFMEKNKYLNNNEIIQLIDEYKAGDREAATAILENFKNLVYSTTKSYNFCSYLEREDLIQDGYLALLSAINKYDKNKDASFFTYAYYAVRGHIFRCLDENTSLLHIPVYIAIRYRKINSFISNFERENNRKPTIEEIQAATALSIEEIYETLLIPSVISFEYCYDENYDTKATASFYSLEGNPESDVLEDEESRRVKQYISYCLHEYLTPREEAIVAHKIGLEDGEAKSFRDIAPIVKISHGMVQRSYKRALAKLFVPLMEINDRDISSEKYEQYNRYSVRKRGCKKKTEN